ncbi:NAD(P)/FAD-dependent oxidoreductase [Hydrogenimonas sp.]
MKIAIIGGGAAGLTAALQASKKLHEHIHIDIYEQNSDVGKKILASGNGRCNISNTALGAENFHGRDPHFVTPALKRFGFREFERFAQRLGLLLEVKPDGRVYPLSNEARSVQEALRRGVILRGVQIFTKKRVVGIERLGGGFLVRTQEDAGRYDRVLLATGSPAAPQLGGSIDGIRLAESLGHRTVEPYPTLVGLHLAGRLHERIGGVKIPARLTLYVDGRSAKRTEGDLLFTKYGISGFAVLDISTEASAYLSQRKGVVVGIHMLPDYDRQGVLSLLQKLSKASENLTVKELMQGVLPLKIVTELLKFAKVDPSVSAQSLDNKSLRRLAATMTDWRFSVVRTHGFKHAETAGGGVLTEDVEPKTLESRIVPGLFFAGEVLDIVGQRGGYNLHWAWASGHLAGEGLVR